MTLKMIADNMQKLGTKADSVVEMYSIESFFYIFLCVFFCKNGEESPSPPLPFFSTAIIRCLWDLH